MKQLDKINNPYGDSKVIDSCSIFGAMDTSRKPFSGVGVIKAIANMHFRGNGLGGGFAIYGLYPDYAEYYAFHLMYLSNKAKSEVEDLLNREFHIVASEEVPTRPNACIVNAPMVWRYFIEVDIRKRNGQSSDDYVVEKVMLINNHIEDAFVFSSGKDMAVFKGVGYPEEIADYFCLENYEGYLWTAHGRFPTNTKGWWGGAHPFSLLDWTVVHNGEISSYGINRRFLEGYGYHCTMHTDTEVVVYAIDLLVREHKLPMEIVAQIFAPPFWDDIARLKESDQYLLHTLRQTYSGLMLNGPFTVIIAHHGEMIGLTDRIRLRPLIVGEEGSKLYLSSEESAIRLISPNLDRTWIPMGGEPVIARVREPQITGELAIV